MYDPTHRHQLQEQNLAEIRWLAKEVLQLLRQRHLIGLRSVFIGMSLFNKRTPRFKDGWKIGDFLYQSYGEQATGTLYLLSNGRIFAGAIHGPVNERHNAHLIGITVQHLRTMKQQLEQGTYQ